MSVPFIPFALILLVLTLLVGSIALGLLVPGFGAPRSVPGRQPAPIVGSAATADARLDGPAIWEPVGAPLEAVDELAASDAWDNARASRAAMGSAETRGRYPVTMSDVVVGIMTCDRFLPTRGLALRSTWLKRARRVLFFADAPFGVSDHAPAAGSTVTGADAAQAAVEAPLIRHAFQPSERERVFRGGNWRAVPILRAVAEAFFTPEAQAALTVRSEPPPAWAFLADDDSFAVTSELERTLSRCIYMHTCIYLSICPCICLWFYVCMYLSICLCVCVVHISPVHL